MGKNGNRNWTGCDIGFMVIQFFFIIIINVGVRVSLRVSRLILWVLKLTTMQVSSSHEVCETQDL